MTTADYTTAARAGRLCMDKDKGRPFGLYCNRPEGHPGSHAAGSDYEVWDRPVAQEGHRRVRKFADDWDTCTCGYDAWPCRSQEPTDDEVDAVRMATHGVLSPAAARAALRAARDVRGQG